MSDYRLRVLMIVFAIIGTYTAVFTAVRAEEESETETTVEICETEIEQTYEETVLTDGSSETEETSEYAEEIEESQETYESYDDSLALFEEYVSGIPACYWRITVYTADDLSYVSTSGYGYCDGVYVFEADSPMSRDSVITQISSYQYEVTESSAPWSYIDRMSPEEAADFYRDFFDIRGISVHDMAEFDEESLESVMAEWDYAGMRAGLNANDLV